MRRTIIKHLERWKTKSTRKPLLIKGARQVGKTWLMKEFGNMSYDQIAYVNFESSQVLKNLFELDFDISRIIMAVEIETGVSINAENTLIIFDEIQETERGITALKYFFENAPQYHIMAAGSLLGVSFHKGVSFPVGKVEFLDLYPLNFSEYLLALEEDKLLHALEKKDWQLTNSFKVKYIELLKQYYFIGGMPEAVTTFIRTKDFSEVRQVQDNILRAYEQDFSKYAPYDIVPRIRMLWNAIPSQLSKENKKFIFSALKKGARAKEFELALSWLIDCGLIYKISRISKPSIPLNAYVDFGAFKLFVLDVGLLAAMGSIDVRTLLKGNDIFTEFKGAITEQYVLQQLMSIDGINIYYWSADNAMAELDFVVQSNGKIIPIEVKAEENLQAKSLKSYYSKYPQTKAVRSSMSDYREEDWLINLPLYAVSLLPELNL